MNRKKDKKAKLFFRYLAYILFPAIILYAIVGNCYRREAFKDPERVVYGIAYSLKIKDGYKTGPRLICEFWDGNHFEKGIYNFSDDLRYKIETQSAVKRQYINKYFLVEYITDYSVFHNIMISRVPSDSLIECCLKRQWQEPPF